MDPAPASDPTPRSLKFPDHWKIFAPQPTAAPAPSPVAGPEASETPPASAGVDAAPTTRILIADDDAIARRIVAARLLNWGYEPVITRDGHEAMAAMRAPDAPPIAILDWLMPGMDGIEVCRRLREINKQVYILFLTGITSKDKVFEALEAGADDYLVKPFDHLELQARIHVGLRIIGLQTALNHRIQELESTIAELRDVRGTLDIPV